VDHNTWEKKITKRKEHSGKCMKESNGANIKCESQWQSLILGEKIFFKSTFERIYVLIETQVGS
jgi:hypothetical protein